MVAESPWKNYKLIRSTVPQICSPKFQKLFFFVNLRRESLSYLSIQDKEKTIANKVRDFFDSCLRFIIVVCSLNLKMILHSQSLIN